MVKKEAVNGKYIFDLKKGFRDEDDSDLAVMPFMARRQIRQLPVVAL